MSTDEVTNDGTEFVNLLVNETNDSCRLQYIEIVPRTRDTDHSSTTECDSGDLSAEVKQEILPVIKQEADDSCILQFPQIGPQILDVVGPCTTECDGGDGSSEVEKEILPAVKQEPGDLHVSFTVILYFILYLHTLSVSPRDTATLTHDWTTFCNSLQEASEAPFSVFHKVPPGEGKLQGKPVLGTARKQSLNQSICRIDTH